MVRGQRYELMRLDVDTDPLALLTACVPDSRTPTTPELAQTKTHTLGVHTQT